MVSETEITTLLRRTRAKFEARAKEDIFTALKNFNDLVPEVRKHTFPDGVERSCFALQGTIPISYKGSTYHIPVALYFADNHPYSGPYCYVRPTSSMRIRSSQQVDDKGRIYLPYLTEWQYPSHDTTGLLQVLTVVFQEKCPVFSVSSSSSKPSTNTATGQTPYPSTNPTPYPSANPTPYPTVPNPAPYPTNTPHMPMPSSYGVPHANASPYPTAGGYQPPYQPYVNVPSAAPASTSIGSGAVGGGYSFGTIQPSHIRASLVSAIEERIRQCLREKLGTPYAELQSISINLQDLRAGQLTLKEMSEGMDREQKELDNILATYREKKLELEKALDAYTSSQTENGDGSDVDRAIDAATPLHRQILRCYVEDCVVDDTIYFLGQALKKGTIDLQTYLKHVRQLSRKQFIARATVQKCRQRANLPI